MESFGELADKVDKATMKVVKSIVSRKIVDNRKSHKANGIAIDGTENNVETCEKIRNELAKRIGKFVIVRYRNAKAGKVFGILFEVTNTHAKFLPRNAETTGRMVSVNYKWVDGIVQ